MEGALNPTTSGVRQMSEPGHDIHPEQYPEARREHQICLGAFESLKVTTKELLQRLSDYTRDSEPEAAMKLSEPMLAVRSPFGRELRSLSEDISNLEQQIRSYLNLLEL